jgi:hypothetical protein
LYFDFGTFWPSVRDFFNSTFFTAIAGSFAGAVGGAYAAQRIVARNRERDELLTEIRNTSAATVVAFDVCNLFVTMKQQHVKPLKDAFERQKTELHTFLTKRNLRQIPPDTAFPFTADLRTLFLPPFPVDTLQKLVFERLSLDERRPLMLISAIGETAHGLNTSVDNRNRLIASYKATHFVDNELLYLYFGLPHGATRITNEEYPSLIDAIYRHTDDGIFFSRLLCEDLFKHNVELVNRFKKDFKTSALTIIDRPDFTKPLRAGLMPNDADYEDWFTLFEKRRQTPVRQGSKSQKVKNASRWVIQLVTKKFHR